MKPKLTIILLLQRNIIDHLRDYVPLIVTVESGRENQEETREFRKMRENRAVKYKSVTINLDH